MTSSEVKIAQIGCGHWGKNLARNFAQLGVLAAVADGHQPAADKIAADNDTVARSLDDILADDSIAGVALATPAATHAELALRAIAAGKHVFVEKPLALDPGDARHVIDAAQAAGKVLMVGHLLQYHPIFLALKAMVGAGELGKLRYVYSNRLSLGKYRTEENILWSFAPHDISMLLALIGEPPDGVSCEGAAFVTPGVADWCICNLRFPSGVRGHVQASWSHPFKEQRLVVVGDAGMAVFDDSESDWNRRLALYRHGIDRSGPVPVPVKAEAEYIEVPRAEPLRAECQHFIDCIGSGARPRTDGEEGIAVLDILHRAEVVLAASLGAL